MTMSQVKVVSNVLKANDTLANENRELMNSAGAKCINIISAPGSGKTTLLEKTVDGLDGISIAVLVGDLQTSRDAERLNRDDSPAIQINTGRGCHLSAEQVKQGLEEFNLDATDLVVIENVGNMVCPTSFDLGEHKRVAMLSIPEGDDKVAKYPTLFQSADVIIISKIDLLGILDFDLQRVLDDIAKVNSEAPLIHLSAKTGDGMDEWFYWLKELCGC
jgi:hydrogenase nickel incorporation protein HypB